MTADVGRMLLEGKLGRPVSFRLYVGGLDNP